ncbi:MAG: FHA domain-containing protein, partial [Planctomycetia bacterium]
MAAAPVLVALDDIADILVEKPIIVIGRSDECDVVVDSKKVSRMHCCLAVVGVDTLVVRDLGSTNGIRVNGEATDESTLNLGDELTIANLTYRVVPMSKYEGPKPGGDRRRISDEELESCDEPVLLSESGCAEIPSMRLGGLQKMKIDDLPEKTPASDAKADRKAARPSDSLERPAGRKS